MPEQLKVKPSVDCHHPASVISASTIPAARCGPAVEGLIPRRLDDKIGVAAAYGRVGTLPGDSIPTSDRSETFSTRCGGWKPWSTERIVISRASHFRANETLSTSEVM